MSAGPIVKTNAWAENFSYPYYRDMLRFIKDNFRIYVVSEALQALQAEGKRLIMRHDVDISLTKALALARVEHQAGVFATYMVIPNALLYSIKTHDSIAILQNILSLGHEVGLHFDLSEPDRTASVSLESVADEIEGACLELESVLGGARVRSLSFHRPTANFLKGPLFVAGRVNAYGKEIFSSVYLSDSGGVWRTGEPIPTLMNIDQNIVQLLTHPIWWGDEHLSAPERLGQYVQNEMRKSTPEARAHLKTILTRVVPGVRGWEKAQ